MDEKLVSGSIVLQSEDTINDGLYPMLFGVSCAFFALRLLPEPEMCDERWVEIRDRMLKGSAHLLGMFVWRVQREVSGFTKSELFQELEKAKKEVEQLRRIRREDARANAKVVGIVAAREQGWFHERRKLRQHIGALMNDLRVLDTNSEKSLSEFDEKLKECEAILQLKDEAIEEGEQKRRETEEKLKEAENLANELRENAKREAQRYSNEISKHKTAFIELVSNQRQIEAEMGRALRQVEAAKQDLDSVLEQKEQFVLMSQSLSMELVNMRKDLEQKDQILSAMLRKSKLDTAERQMLLKEVKSSKAKKKQAELESAKWKTVSESKHERHSLRNMLLKHVNAKSDIFLSGKGVHSLALDTYSTDRTEEQQLTDDMGRLENWVNSEAEKYRIAIDQRHNLELDAFAEQLRIKDEKVEAYRWRLLSMELESKRLQSHMAGLDHDITQLRQDNMKLEALLLDREAELHTLKEQLVLQFKPPNLQKLHLSSSPHETAIAHDTVWSKVKIVKRKPGQKRHETKAIAEEIPQEVEIKVEEIQVKEQLNDIVLTLKSSDKEAKEGKVPVLQPDHVRQGSIDSQDSSVTETSTSTSQVVLCNKNNSTWRMDIHALGVSYKIKRLRQQLLMLERLTGKQASSEKSENNFGTKGFCALMSLLNKQIDRYQSLQGKTDDLCERMHEGHLNLNCGGSTIAKTNDETRKLEHFLEETFQLQRYIVATGQKLMEVQAKIASGFVADSEVIEKPESFDIKRFGDSIRTLFREVQQGLEVRISRIIGDLGGTLACDGIMHLKK